MKHINKRESPPPNVKLKESPALIRAICAAYAEELSAITDYTYAQILLKPWLPAVADIFSTLSRAEMHHYHQLGELLRDLGVSHALRTTITTTPYRLLEDADSHAPVLAERILKDRLQDEKNASSQYKRLSENAVTERARSALCALAEDEQDHAAVLEAIAKRLDFS